MRKQNPKKNNHLYPKFHIKKWIDSGGKIYDKEIENIRKWNSSKDYTLKYYYSLGEENSELEDRISKFETYIAPIILKIDKAESEVVLTGKELELLKLYCVLCGSRHSFTSEVIKEDESGIYQSNNYLWGLHRAESQEQAIGITQQIIRDFENIVSLDENIESQISHWMIDPQYVYSTYTVGLHIAIGRADSPMLCISDRFCIIENTMDSDFLYSYVPISPKTALFLVKSKYYMDQETFDRTKVRFGEKYGSGIPDQYLSVIMGSSKIYDAEDALFCSYYRVRSCVHVKETYLTRNTVSKATVKINVLPKFVFQQFNSVFCEDGTKILFCDEDQLKFALNHKLNCRKIIIG